MVQQKNGSEIRETILKEASTETLDYISWPIIIAVTVERLHEILQQRKIMWSTTFDDDDDDDDVDDYTSMTTKLCQNFFVFFVFNWKKDLSISNQIYLAAFFKFLTYNKRPF